MSGGAVFFMVSKADVKRFQKMLIEGQAVANLVTDAHLAALAYEHGCEFISTDTDFSRFPGIRWKNPLK